MGRISEHSIEQVRSAADILDVVSGYVPLKRRGRNHFGPCPFHQEKTPSFSVNEAKQIYHCFGCGAGGGVINFIMEVEKLDFVEAVKFLADRYGVQLEISGDNKPPELMTQLSEIQERAATFYQKNLGTPAGKEVVDYFLNRGLSEKTIKEFRLGYGPKGWTTLLDLVRKENYSADAMSQCGLFVSSEKGYFDRFRDRIMFTLMNPQGKAVGFAGRVFKGDDPAKYVNSPETPLYNKSNLLYGLWVSKKAIRDSNRVIIVEGYLDFLQLYQAGIEDIAAVSGTAFTDGHARELRKYTRNVFLAYDGDAAGQSAAVRAGYVLLKNGLNPRIVSMPEGMDPDDWVKNEGPDPFNQALESASDLLAFQLDGYAGDLSEPSIKAQYIREVLQELMHIPDPIVRELYVKELAEITSVTVDTVFQYLEGLLRKQQQRQPLQRSDRRNEVSSSSGRQLSTRLEDELILLCLSEDESLRHFISEHMSADWFTSPANRVLYDTLLIHLSSGTAPDVNTVLDGLEKEDYRKKLAQLVFELENITPTIEMAQDCLVRLEQRYNRRQQEAIRSRLQQGDADPVEISQMLTEIDLLQRQQKNIPNKYSRKD